MTKPRKKGSVRTSAGSGELLGGKGLGLPGPGCPDPGAEQMPERKPVCKKPSFFH